MNNSILSEFRNSIRRIERFLFASIKDDGTCCGVTFNECHILMEIDKNRKIVMKDLAGTLGMDKSIISRSIEGMVRNDLISREELTDDRRKKNIVLTGNGKKKADSINQYMNTKYSELFSSMNESEVEKVIESAKILADLFDKWALLTANSECCRGGNNDCCN